jgi:hypothetical protein
MRSCRAASALVGSGGRIGEPQVPKQESNRSGAFPSESQPCWWAHLVAHRAFTCVNIALTIFQK